MPPGVIMSIVVRQASSGPLWRNLDPRLARCAGIALTAAALALLCSSCGLTGSTSKSSGGNAAGSHPAANPSAAQNNPDVPTAFPTVPETTSPAQNNPDVPGPTMTPSASTSAPTGTVYVPQGEVAKVYTEPSVSSAAVTTLSGGTVVEILCTAQGDTVTNTAGQSSSLWDDTQYGYIPDVNVDTGTTQPVAAACT